MYVIPLSQNCPRKMKLRSHSGVYAMLRNSIENSFVKEIEIVLILSICKIWLLAIVKSRHFGCSSMINRSLLFVR